MLLNDWSARDIQAWETRPLGPFLAKSFATSISHWVVPLDALAAHRAASRRTRRRCPTSRRTPWAFDVALELELNGTRRRAHERGPAVLERRPADRPPDGQRRLACAPATCSAPGTISGPERDQRGSLLELSWNGDEPIELADGSTRTFLEDGDEVVLRGAGLGEVRGRVSGR